MNASRVFMCHHCRDSANHCLDDVTSTLHMPMNDVIYGSVIGNTTNPLILEVDSWVNNQQPSGALYLVQ